MAWKRDSGSVRKPAHDARTPSVSTNQRAHTDRNLVMTRVTTDYWSAEKVYPYILYFWDA